MSTPVTGISSDCEFGPISIGAAVNDEATLRQNLGSSAILVSKDVEFRPVTGAESAALAYNQILDNVITDYVVLCHQDVYLPDEFEMQLRRAVARLNAQDPKWAVLGIVGKTTEGKVVGSVWSNGLQAMVGSAVAEPCPVISIDELLIVVRKSSGLRFDEGLPGFHLYGTDIVLDGLERGYRAYVIHAPVIHNSVSVGYLDKRYVRAYRFMQRKWARRLPLQTLIVPVTNTAWPIYWSHLFNMKRWLKGRRPVMKRHPAPREMIHLLESEKLS